jgi:hypothetical protein
MKIFLKEPKCRENNYNHQEQFLTLKKKLNKPEIVMKIFIYFVFIGTLVLSCFAQNYEFCVLGKYGTVKIFRHGKKWDELKTGDKLKKDDVVSLKDSAYLGLVHYCGKTIELKKNGEYKIESLSRQILASSAELMPNLIELIFGNLNDLDDLLLSKQNKKVSYTKGAIERGITEHGIILTSPRKINLLNSEVILSWLNLPLKGKFEVRITDRFNKPVFSKVVEDTFLVINKNDLNLDKDEYYFWKVNLPDNPEVRSDEAYFLFLSDNKSSEINKNIEQLKKQLGGIETPPSKIMLAFFYENNLLINEADKAFRDAIELSHGVKDYKELYYAFRQRAYLTK